MSTIYLSLPPLKAYWKEPWEVFEPNFQYWVGVVQLVFLVVLLRYAAMWNDFAAQVHVPVERLDTSDECDFVLRLLLPVDDVAAVPVPVRNVFAHFSASLDRAHILNHTTPPTSTSTSTLVWPRQNGLMKWASSPFLAATHQVADKL
jgi:hypothetical protein